MEMIAEILATVREARLIETELLPHDERVRMYLRDWLNATVPIITYELELRGGPSEWEFVRCCQIAVDAWVTTGADKFMFSPGSVDRSRLLAQTAEAVACMAFVPGGVEIFGCSFKAGKANPTFLFGARQHYFGPLCFCRSLVASETIECQRENCAGYLHVNGLGGNAMYYCDLCGEDGRTP